MGFTLCCVPTDQLVLRYRAVKDVLYEPVRKTQEATHFMTVPQPDGTNHFIPCSPGNPQVSWKYFCFIFSTSTISFGDDVVMMT
jgi:hypothetical protein